MADVLVQLFVALGVSIVGGFVLGFTAGVHRRPGRPAPAPDLAAVVEREASLIEALARADADLQAHATELADANEEIVCLLDQLHEARRATQG